MAGKAQMLSSRSMISDVPPAVMNSHPRIVVGANSTAGLDRVPSNLRDGNGVRSQISERPSPYSSQDRNSTETDYREFRNSLPFDRSEKSTQLQLKHFQNNLLKGFPVLNIDSPSCLIGVVSQIYDKALMEPTFCEMYAKFCVRLSQGLPEFYADNEKVTFKRVLVNKCQEEFEKDEQEQEAADKDDDGENKLSTEEKAEKKAAARRRMLGNIRFIGELYKENMLTERIMHECIRKLLGDANNSDGENIEALCTLMSTVGKMIDHRKAKEHIDAYFEIMSRMSSSQALPSRLRFMLRDVIDLRRNGWQQRRKVEGPKKIDEVHRDAAQELHGGIPSRGVALIEE